MIERLKRISMSELVFLLFITTIIVSELTLSRYGETLTRQDEAMVAVMGNDVLFNISSPVNIYPGSDPVIIPIVITNKEDGRICNVSQSFSITLVRNEIVNIPFQYSLYKDSGCTEIIPLDENGYYTDSTFKLRAGVEDSKTYYLKVTWPEDYNSESYAFEIDYIQFLVDSIQID